TSRRRPSRPRSHLGAYVEGISSRFATPDTKRELLMTTGSMQTDTVIVTGAGDADVDCYFARPSGPGPFPGVVVLQHIFGVDEWIMEVCRKLAHFGYAAIAPNFYARIGSLGSGAAEDLGARLRSLGGLDDKVVTGDISACVDYLKAMPESNGRVGTIGFCMGGLHGYAAACRLTSIDATIDCWGGNVAPDPQRLEQMAAQGLHFAPVQETAAITAPLLGIFGVEDRNPNLAE